MDFLKIAETIVLPEFTWVWCFAIAAYAGFWILMFATKAMVTAWLLRKVPRRILKISGEEPVGERLQVFEKEFLKYGVLSESWQEFKKTFVLAKDDGEGVRDAARSQRTPLFGVKAVKSAKNFFTEDLILHKVINVRAMQGVSGQLTGLGILGTFVGLAAGVFLAQGQLFEANLDTMHQGLVRLLSGASLAFWTSVVGILSSLVFSRFESGLMQLLSKRLRGFAYQLDRMFSVEPVEMMSHDQLMEQKGQTKLLEQIAADIHCMTTDHIQLNERLMVQMIQEFKRLLTHEAKREIEAVIDGLREVKEGLRGATNIFKDTQTGYCEATKVGSEMMSRSVLNLTGTLDHFSRRTMEHVSQTKEVTDDLKDLFSRVAPEFESTVNQLGKLNQNLKNFHGDMNSNQDKVQKTMKGIVENFDMVGNKFRDLLHTDVFSTIKNFVSVMDQTTKSTVDRIDNAAVVATKNLKSPLTNSRGALLCSLKPRWLREDIWMNWS